MKFFKGICILVIFMTRCSGDEFTPRIKCYLKEFGKSIADYRIICISPAEGCSTCIDPSLEYSRTAGDDFLLVLTSVYEKSIRFTIKTKMLDSTRIVIDHDNLAVSYQLVIPTAPCYYFIEKGKVAW